MNEQSVCNPNLELQITKLKLPETRDTYIVNIYRPPAGNLTEAVSTLTDVLNNIEAQNTPDIVILGDMNVDLLKHNSDSNKIRQFARINKLTQLIDSPTRVTNTGSTLIDRVYTNTISYYEG